MPIIAAGLTAGSELLAGAGAAGFGALDAGAAALGIGTAEAAGAGAGALGAADLIGAGTAGTLAADAAVGGELGALGLAGEAGVPGAVAAEAPFAGFGAGVPFADAGGVVSGEFSALGADAGAASLPGTTGYAAFPGYSPITAGTPGAVTGAVDFGTLPGVGAADSLAQPLAYAGGAPAALPGVTPTAAGGGAVADLGGPGIGSGGFNFIDAQAGAAPGIATGAPTGADTGVFSGALKSLGVTPIQAAGAAVAGGGLLYNLVSGQKPLPEATALQGQIGQTNKLLADFQAGKLPPGYKAAVDSATAAARATIISNYASRGLPTDPTKNSALAQELAGAERNALVMTAQIGEKLLQGGLQAVGMETQIYDTLLKLDVQQSQATGQAIAAFAGALAGGANRGGQTITVKAA